MKERLYLPTGVLAGEPVVEIMGNQISAQYKERFSDSSGLGTAFSLGGHLYSLHIHPL